VDAQRVELLGRIGELPPLLGPLVFWSTSRIAHPLTVTSARTQRNESSG
jgi:hypothetical protein